MSAHTKGPWTVVALPKGTRLAVEDARGEWVADARAWTLSKRGLDEQQANARLIAAAPDLLTCLKETTDVLARIYRGESVAGRVLDALDSGRAAIAKTGGRS